MATVSMTSDLEPYLASLRSYLAQNKPSAENSAEEPTNAVHNHDDRDAQRDQPYPKAGKDNNRVGHTRPVMKNRPCRTH
ncbi:hypothetical protein BO94DRAFT_533944 [Aspergillus sclerotioniger CBS 115572]|uniref:Uncharacterized protein n=1 Tax=Aspergillus sclerotioniger CBS 115572 TaxID=1450535 RepID=A0A317WYW2_9EURO|nr:hypothetical protein BO94DRAFT_533944 [Aspergillus sclerotioniger CBS 115572]PWY90457.1 hypothetical protein BO94DRAFT_533944 [Aspergillus sclerotioniger CBS 115572]